MKAPGATVSIDVDRQPFWVVMGQMTAKTGIELREPGGTWRRQAHRAPVASPAATPTLAT